MQTAGRDCWMSATWRLIVRCLDYSLLGSVYNLPGRHRRHTGDSNPSAQQYVSHAFEDSCTQSSAQHSQSCRRCDICSLQIPYQWPKIWPWTDMILLLHQWHTVAKKSSFRSFVSLKIISYGAPCEDKELCCEWQYHAGRASTCCAIDLPAQCNCGDCSLTFENTLVILVVVSVQMLTCRS